MLPSPPPSPLPAEVDLLISHAEVNQHHGVGIFLQRLFGVGTGFACLRSTTMYGGSEAFGTHHMELRSRSLTAPETEARLASLLAGFRVRRILCVPYYREDFVHATLAHKLTGAPLCTYLMDDQNIFAAHVSDHWVSRLLQASNVRLGISEEMCVSYERKYGHRMYLLPPVVESRTDLMPCYWQPEMSAPMRCAMIGNIWSAHRFEQLRALLRNTGVEVDWYGKGPSASWLDGKVEEWEQDNVRCLGFLSEEDLIAALASYPFILIPSGTADGEDDNPAFSRLSLPSRLVFLHARTDTPVLVLGSPRTAAGHFVERLGTGRCAAPEPGNFRAQIATMTDPDTHARMRRRIRDVAPALVLSDGGEWIWQTLASGTPPPASFASIFPAPTAARCAEIAGDIEPARPIPTMSENEKFTPTAFAYSRRQQVDVLHAASLLPAISPDELEVTEFIRAAAFHHAIQLTPAGADVLYLGATPPDVVNRTPTAFRVWKIANFADWLTFSSPTLAPVIVFHSGPPTTAEAPAAFATVWSAGTCDGLPGSTDAIQQFSAAADHLVLPGGWHIHIFSAVLHPDYQWVHPLYTHLRQRFLGRRFWPGWDDVLSDESTYFMSPAAYERYWQQHTGKTPAEFGRVLWLSVAWQAGR